MNIAILILAAGSSSRMKTTKQLLPIGKTTLLGATIEYALQSNTKRIYCVLGANAETIKTSISKYNIETISNPNYKSGLSSSIATGIQHISNQNFDAVLLVLGDQPLITSSYFNEMINTFKKHSKKIIASGYNTNLGVPAIIPKIYFNDLLSLEGDKGAKTFLNSKKDKIIKLDSANVMDIDTPKEYQDYINSINFE